MESNNMEKNTGVWKNYRIKSFWDHMGLMTLFGVSALVGLPWVEGVLSFVHGNLSPQDAIEKDSMLCCDWVWK